MATSTTGEHPSSNTDIERQALWRHMYDEHELILTQSELDQIVRIAAEQLIADEPPALLDDAHGLICGVVGWLNKQVIKDAELRAVHAGLRQWLLTYADNEPTGRPPPPPKAPTYDRDAALKEFTAYFIRNYPGQNTIISDPTWHAPKIFRAAEHAIKSSSSGTAPAQVSGTAEAGHPLTKPDAQTLADRKLGQSPELPDETSEPPAQFFIDNDGAIDYGTPPVDECQHDLLRPDTTIEVIDAWKAKCKVCITFFDLPGRSQSEDVTHVDR